MAMQERMRRRRRNDSSCFDWLATKTAGVLQPAKDMRKKKADELVPYLPGDGPSLPMDVRVERFVNIERVSYRVAETVCVLGRQIRGIWAEMVVILPERFESVRVYSADDGNLNGI